VIATAAVAATLFAYPLVNEANDQKRVGRHYVPARRDVRDGPLGRNGKDEFDLADIGGEAHAATHAASITAPARGPKRVRPGDADTVMRPRRVADRNGRLFVMGGSALFITTC
jgi:hypothetical protein